MLIGEHTFNFLHISEDAVADGAAARVEDAVALMRQWAQLMADPARMAAMAQAATMFAQRHQGATARSLVLLQPLMGRA